MKLAICDDEKDIRNYIEKCAKEIFPDLEIEKYPDTQNVLKSGFDADILFLDIQMPGVDGMKTARILRTTGSKTVIVFVTAVEELVFQAFDVDAIQYIVKPFDKSKLQDAIRKSVSTAEEQKNIDHILSSDEAGKDNSRFFVVKSGGINTRVILADIAYAEIFDRRIVLHMHDKECIEYYGRMSDLEQAAGNDFFRIHRAYLINLKYVTSYDCRSVCVLGIPIPVARGKYPELVKAYMSYYTRQEKL